MMMTYKQYYEDDNGVHTWKQGVFNGLLTTSPSQGITAAAPTGYQGRLAYIIIHVTINSITISIININI